MSTFFEKFGFVPTFTFDFNSWGLKWKDVIPSIHLSQNNLEKLFNQTHRWWKWKQNSRARELMPIFL